MQREEEGFKGGKSGGGLGSSIAANSGLMFHAGSITHCSSTDQSWFCYLSRLVGIIGNIIFLIVIVYIIYIFVWPWVAEKLGFGKRSGRRGK